MADADSIKDAAEDIVSGPEYRVPEPAFVQRGFVWLGDRLEPVGDAIGRFLEWLAGLFDITAGGSQQGGSGGFLLGWILLAIAAAAAVWFLIRVMPRRRLRAAAKSEPVVEQRTRHRATRKEWLKRAAEAEAERDFTGAVRARYRALIAGLADRSELAPDEALTSGEHLRSFDADGKRVERFTQATDRYERAWYGDEPVVLDDSQELAGIDHELVEGGRS